jgi:hypothetical protein
MSNPIRPEIICRRCRAVLEATDDYCHNCGGPTANLAARKPSWSESPWVILPLLFLILGPLALPLLWRSRRFTTSWKSILTVVVTGITVFVGFELWQTVQQTLVELQKLQTF